jgi:hypothetical protein
VLENPGNVPLSITGLDSTYRAVKTDGSPCSFASLAPVTNVTCDFWWNVTSLDSEAGNGTIYLEATGMDASIPEANGTASLMYTGTAALVVPQHAAVLVTLQEVSPKVHAASGKGT